MPERKPDRDRGGRRPTGAGQGGGGGGAKRAGGLRLRALEDCDFEFDHPRCVREMEPDFEEGIELRKAGEIEDARDALRYALQGCGDNMWVHVALGWIALDDFRDPELARGHFGYAFELGRRAVPRDFAGRLPPQRPANRPLYDAVDGLAECYQALNRPRDAAEIRDLADRWASGPRPGPAPTGP